MCGVTSTPRYRVNMTITFKTHFDYNDLLPKTLKSANCKYDAKEIFLITRMRYKNGFLYLFLTGYNDVQFCYKTKVDVHTYRECAFHSSSCQNNCRLYKNAVVTGLKSYQCSRINVYKVNRSHFNNTKDKYALDDFCYDEHRVMIEHGIHEGQYVSFAEGVRVNNFGIAVGPVHSIVFVDPSTLKQIIRPIIGCYDLETYTNITSMSTAERDPIISIGYVLKKQDDIQYYCFVNVNAEQYKLNDAVVDENTIDVIHVLPFKSERAMIQAFLDFVCRSNPDVLLDYNGDGFDLQYLMDRADKLNIDQKFIVRYNLEKANIEKKLSFNQFHKHFYRKYLVYFNHVDLYQYFLQSIYNSKLENLSLNTVSDYFLKQNKLDLKVKEMMDLYHKKEFTKIIVYNVRDCLLPIELFQKCQINETIFANCNKGFLTYDDYALNMTKKNTIVYFGSFLRNTDEHGSSDPYIYNTKDLNIISNRFGNISSSSSIHKPKRIKFSDCFEDMEEENDDDDDDNEHNAGTNEPDGTLFDFTKLPNRRPVPINLIPKTAVPLCDTKACIKYTGGKVLSPKPGYYSTLFTLDFAQLYTSIMMKHTCCVSNIFLGQDKKVYLDNNPQAVCTKLLKSWASSRAMYKAEMKKYDKNSFQYNLNNANQEATKLLCNGFYGFFGIICKPLANFITAKGREKLTEAQNFLKGMSNDERILRKYNLSKCELNVVYGDTDSNFVNINIPPHEYERMGGQNVMEQLIKEDILKPLNDTWGGDFKMELENIMNGTLIKGKKMYVCLKADGSLYKRGLNVKKDVPIFIRQAFDEVFLNILTLHSLDCVLQKLVETLKSKYDEFDVLSNVDKYSFSQTLNENKNGDDGKAPSLANILCMQLRNNGNTQFIPQSGDRIPYLLMDKQNNKVNNLAKPTQLLTTNDTINWSKHLRIITSYFNDLVGMLGDHSIFLYALDQICTHLQQNQNYNICHAVLKPMTLSRMKTIICKEQNVKKTNTLSNERTQSIIDNKEIKFKHTHEFHFLKTNNVHKILIDSFNPDCPMCNNRGESAVDKPNELLEIEFKTNCVKAKKINKDNNTTTTSKGTKKSVSGAAVAQQKSKIKFFN